MKTSLIFLATALILNIANATTLRDVFTVAEKCYEGAELLGLELFHQPGSDLKLKYKVGHACSSEQGYEARRQDVRMNVTQRFSNSCVGDLTAELKIDIAGPGYRYQMHALRDETGLLDCRFKKKKTDHSHRNAVERFFIEETEEVYKKTELFLHPNEFSCKEGKRAPHADTVISTCSGWGSQDVPNSSTKFEFIVEVDLKKRTIENFIVVTWEVEE